MSIKKIYPDKNSELRSCIYKATISVEIVRRVILKLQQSGMSILLVEQNLRSSQKYTDFIHILSRGHIVHSSPPGDLEGRQDIKQQFLGV